MKNWLVLLMLALACLPTMAWADPPIKVACVGDSITYGYNLPDPATQSYPSVLGRLLGSGYQVRNFGVSGRCMLKKGVYPYWAEAAFQQSLDFQPDVVVIQLGTNDILDNNFGYIDDFVGDYEDMIARYRALNSHPIVYICLPTPITGNFGHGYSAPRFEEAILPRIRQVASETGAPLIDNDLALSDVPQDFLDTVHPNIDGALRLAGNVYLSVAPPGSAAPNIYNDTDSGISYQTTVTNATGVSTNPGLTGGLAGGFTYMQNRTAGDIREDLHVSRTVGDSVSYTFTGTGIDLISELSSEGGGLDCYIDSNLVSTVNCFTPNLYAQQAVFSSTGLAPGTHTFRAVHKGAVDPTQQATQVATDDVLLKVDGFRVYNPIADFAISGFTRRLNLARGASATAAISVQGTNGYRGTTTFQALGLPAGVSAHFTPATVSGTQNTTLLLSAVSDAPVGPATITLEGDCGPVHRRMTLALTVVAPSAAATLKTHVLWTNPDGKAILWNAAADGTFAIAGIYGPYPDAGSLWKAIFLATGPDGLSHILWTHPSGKAVLWNMAADGTFIGTPAYGPYKSADGLWSAQSVSVGPDNVPRLLWTNPNGMAAVWNVAPDGTFSVVGTYGPYQSAHGLWSARTLSVGPDNTPHLLWNNPDGTASLWNVAPDGTFTVAGVYGPYTDQGGLWQATTLSVAPDNMPHLLWNNPDGRALLWDVAPDGTFTIMGVYGSYTNWSAKALATGPDGLNHLLWTNPTGLDALWSVDGQGKFTPFVYGPYTDDPDNLWTAVAISAST